MVLALVIYLSDKDGAEDFISTPMSEIIKIDRLKLLQYVKKMDSHERAQPDLQMELLSVVSKFMSLV